MMSVEGSIHICTPSAGATKRVAAAVAGFAKGGDLILLVGDLGAGKTVFAQGFASGLGIEDRVTSPTFALVQSYEGDMVMHHLDVYRLAHSSEVADLGLSELLDEDAVTLIEWGDMIVSALPNDFLEVNLLAVESGALTPDSTARVATDPVGGDGDPVGGDGDPVGGDGDPGGGPADPGGGPADPVGGDGDPGGDPADPGGGHDDDFEDVSGRKIVLTARGPSWRPRMGALHAAIVAAQERDGDGRC